MGDDDFEIQEPLSYAHKDEVYSHSMLVMSALKDCKDKRSKEMRDGYWNVKFDRAGNAHRVWIGDSMKEFVESVEALMMLQERDYDPDAENAIKGLKDKLYEKYEELCKLEKEEWGKMPYDYKQQLGKEGFFLSEGLLSEKLKFNGIYTRYKISYYTKIVSEIQKLIKRKGDYQEEIYEA